MTNYDKESFQKQIIHEYASLKQIADSLSDYSKNPYGRFTDEIKEPKSIKQRAKSVFFRIVAYVEASSLSKLTKTPEYLNYVEKSKEIISTPKIKSALCPLFKSEIASNLLDEEKSIKIIKILSTVIVDETETSKGLSINLDPKLFAFAALEIEKEGINTYCSQEN